jgi:hypothetical protein
MKRNALYDKDSGLYVAGVVQKPRTETPPREAQPGRSPEPRGLCATCLHADACAYRQRQAGPVVFCEEFEIEQPPEPLTTAFQTATAADFDDLGTTLPGGRVRGLCVNCVHRQTCRLPKPESGVWHCEEYE